jgi:hypothetical protein
MGLALTACSSITRTSAPIPGPAVFPGPTVTPGPTVATGPTATLATATLKCADFIGVDAPGAQVRAVLGGVALATAQTSALQTSRTGDSGATRLFGKSPLLVRVGETSQITVADADHQSIAWGKPGTTTKRLVIPACPAVGSATWLVYPGGYFVDHPRCAAFVVTHRGQQQTIRIGVGLACPGQKPPPPTET